MAGSQDGEPTGKNVKPLPGTPDAQTAMRRKLAKRMAFAAVMIAALLGALALVDQLSQPEPIEAPAPRPPVPLPKQEDIKPVKPAPEAAEKGAEPGSKAADLPPKPEIAAQPKIPATPETKVEPKGAPRAPVAVPEASRAPTPPAAQGKILPAPTPPASARSGAELQSNQAAPAIQTAPKAETPPAALTSRPGSLTLAPATSAAAPSSAPAVRPPPAAPRLLSGYVLQAGVFASVQRAQELQAKLVLAGVPATIESRVQVGPFKTRAEADEAYQKLKALGVDAVLIAPKPQDSKH